MSVFNEAGPVPRSPLTEQPPQLPGLVRLRIQEGRHDYQVVDRLVLSCTRTRSSRIVNWAGIASYSARGPVGDLLRFGPGDDAVLSAQATPAPEVGRAAMVQSHTTSTPRACKAAITHYEQRTVGQDNVTGLELGHDRAEQGQFTGLLALARPHRGFEHVPTAKLNATRSLAMGNPRPGSWVSTWGMPPGSLACPA